MVFTSAGAFAITVSSVQATSPTFDGLVVHTRHFVVGHACFAVRATPGGILCQARAGANDVTLCARIGFLDDMTIEPARLVRKHRLGVFEPEHELTSFVSALEDYALRLS